MQPEDIAILIGKYLAGEATNEERLLLEKWYRSAYEAPIELDVKKAETKQRIKERIFNELGLIIPAEETAREPAAKSGRKSIHLIWRSAVAIAAAILIFFAGKWILKPDFLPQDPGQVAGQVDLLPGHKGAVLYLADGRTIVLDQLKDGLIASQGGLQIIKESDGIRYQGQNLNVGNLKNRLVTDYGRQWKVTLPDGTKVWLNAVSSLQYPLEFTKETRTVTLTGEGYFEVVHDANHPFRVIAGKKIIEDIGTAFNINAYTDEPAFTTTVMEGRVRLKDHRNALVLSGGQQAIVTDRIKLRDSVDMGTVLAWKEGYFQFEGAGLEEVMRQVSRWYHVDVVYEGQITPQQFNGRIPKNMPASKVLDILQQAGIVFTIKSASSNGVGGRILVRDAD